jgi:hypothetical protein
VSAATEFDGFALALGTVRGSRAFAVDDDGFLTGVTFRARWGAGVNVAECMRRRAPECEHEQALLISWSGGHLFPQLTGKCGCPTLPDPCGDSPGRSCKCGFYAFYEGSNDYAKTSTVAAVVEAWGRTVVGTRGFRASKARIVAIYLPAEVAPEPRTVTETTKVDIPARPWEADAFDRSTVWWWLAGGATAMNVALGAWAAAAGVAVVTAWNLWDIRSARALHASTEDTVQAPRTRRRKLALRTRAHTVTTTHVRTLPQRKSHLMNVGAAAGTTLTAAQRDRIRANYPDVPVYDDLARMLADFPPDPGHLDTTKEA